MALPIFISDEEIKNLLNWDTLVPVIENALSALSKNEITQPKRLVMKVPSKKGSVLHAMPAFSESHHALGCKLLTSFPNNKEKGIPSVLATILFMDSETGKVKVIMEGTEITAWRTAAVSVVGTKYLHHGQKKVLAILGSGIQGRIHALAMKHCFNFSEVRIWNRTPERANHLAKELGPWAVHYINAEECVRGADVIITATYTGSPILMLNWVKPGALINAVGAGITHHSELQESIYTDNQTTLIVDQMEAALTELKGLVDIGVKIEGEIGQIMDKDINIPSKTKITVFHAHGMAIEDVLASKLVYEEYIKRNKKN